MESSLIENSGTISVVGDLSHPQPCHSLTQAGGHVHEHQSGSAEDARLPARPLHTLWAEGGPASVSLRPTDAQQ